ncbi:hypothetical protein BDZ97DRAFT_1921973 [Flammula alnicola]|nr:hypothetical protein BDZ97DRAFT_1921973 [Flammula alnicola]
MNKKASGNTYIASENTLFSGGRGGVGNIKHSRSRDPHCGSLSHIIPSTRCGWPGNIVSGNSTASAYIDEKDHRTHRTSRDRHHSTGCAGTANLTQTTKPAIERYSRDHEPPEFEFTGRGGVGNTVRKLSMSRTRS